MRVYFTTGAARAEEILREGFNDLYEEFGRRGVYFADRPLDDNDGFAGEVTLCLDVPADVFFEPTRPGGCFVPPAGFSCV